MHTLASPGFEAVKRQAGLSERVRRPVIRVGRKVYRAAPRPGIAALALLAGAVYSSGCAPLWVGAGAAGAGAAYEARNKHELDEAKKDLKAGRISEQEYGTRKDEIEDRSAIY
jgi:hypothetical protein